MVSQQADRGDAMTDRDKLIYALMFLEIGDDRSICDAHDLIGSALRGSPVPTEVIDRIAARTTKLIISGVFNDEN